MPRMTETELKLWCERLSHADRVWEDQGLVAERIGSKQALGPKGEDVWRFIRSYRMDQWDGSWGGIPMEHLSTTTLAFALFNTWASGLLSRNPRVQVLPRLRSGSTHAIDVAKDSIVVEALYNYDVQKLKFKRQWNRALRDSFFAPFGLVRHGYTPVEEMFDDQGYRMERYAMARPDRPWMRSYRPWDVRIDPLAATFEPDEDARWVAFRQLRSMDDIKKNPNLIDRRDLQPNVSLQLTPAKRRLRSGNPDVVKMVESWVVYDGCERKWFEIVHGLEKPLREPEDWPLPWEALPYSLLSYNEQMDSPFCVPYMAAVFPTILERNKLRTIMVELTKRLRRVVFVNRQQLADREWEKLEDSELVEFLATKDGFSPAEMVSQIQLGGLPSELIALDAQFMADVREALGQSQLDRAQRVNVETAQEAAAIQQGSAVAAQRNQERTEDFINSAIRHYAIARQATTTEDELIPLVGREDVALLMDNIGSAPFFRVTPQQLRGEYDYQIEAGSTQQRSAQQDMAMAAADLNLWATNPAVQQFAKGNQLVLNYFLARRLNPAAVMQTMQEMQRTAQLQGGIPNQGPPVPDQSNLIETIAAMQGGSGGVPQ